MPGEMFLTHGLPGSGKSTWAEAQVAQDPANSIRVNRDDIRTHRFGESYHKGKFAKKDEDEVARIQQQLIRSGLGSNKKVYCDDTNLNTRTISTLVRLAQAYDAPVRQQYFDVPAEECKRRNAARGAAGGRLVPDFVIDRMAAAGYDEEGHIKDFLIGGNGVVSAVPKNTPGMKKVAEFNARMEKKNPFLSKAVVLLDVDGSLANNGHDAAYAFGREGEKKNFPYFFRSIRKAPVNSKVRDLVNRMRDEDELNIVVMTGREDGYAEELIEFLENSGAKISRLIVKRAGDFRPDNEFKAEQLAKLREEGLIVVHSVDDRPRSIAVWEMEKIMVSRVDFLQPVYNPNNRGPFPEPEVNTVYGSGYCIRCGQPLKSGNIGPKCKTKM